MLQRSPITEIARSLRRDMTSAEKAFWEIVRNRRIQGKKFLRQYPLRFVYDSRKRFFIADFYCSEKKLIVEIDGGIHEHQKDYDELRSGIVKSLDYSVMRFTNNEVLHNTDVVVAMLNEILR